MNNVFWIGVYPGLSNPMLDHIVATITSLVAQAKAGLRIV
jgi:CDP-6-deoxy-D-xylo-4-hexulose-3-dehydrase